MDGCRNEWINEGVDEGMNELYPTSASPMQHHLRLAISDAVDDYLESVTPPHVTQESINQ